MNRKTIVGMIALCVLSASHVLAVEWEVWLSDQSNSADISVANPTGTFGSRILVYEGRAIMKAQPGTYGENHPSFGPVVIEAVDVFPNAFSAFGVNVERLHGMLPHPSHRFMNANFFGPGVGLVGIIDAEGQCTLTAEGDKICGPIRGTKSEAVKLAKALFRTTGPEGSLPSNHMSTWSTDGTKLIIANLGAKLLERIDYDQETDTFTFNKAATLDLVGGRDLTVIEAQADPTLPAGRVSGEYANFQTLYTPSGALKQGPGRPNNVAICAVRSSNSQHIYVTLGGGGLFVVDMTTEPMSIVAEYTDDVISVAGCGGIEGGGFMHLNSGVSASDSGADDSTFILYRLPLDYPDGAAPYTVPNEPPVVKFFEEKKMDITSEAELAGRRDAHGMDISLTHRYLYQFDRIQNNAEVFDIDKIINDPNATLSEQLEAHTATIDLTGSGLCIGDPAPFVNHDGEGYEFSDDPAPDFLDMSPDDRMLIVAFRGPHPVSVKHASLGSCPGFGAITLEGDGSIGTLTHVFRTFLPDVTGTKNLSDIHAAVVRIKGQASATTDDDPRPSYRTEVEATVLGDAVADLIVEFSRAIAGRQPHYAWRDTTGADGRVTLTITTEDQASGYYLARARTAGGEVVGQWHSIPLNDNRRQVLELPLGGSVRVVAVEGLAAGKRAVGAAAPTTSSLEPNHPNPFNSSTVIPYSLAVPGSVRLVIYNTLGQPVRTLVNEFQTAGFYQVFWDARDERGVEVASGVYLTRLSYPGGVQTQRLLLLR